MLTVNEQHLKLAFGHPLESQVAADFPRPTAVPSENKGRSRSPFIYAPFDTNIISETILMVFKSV